MPRTVRKYFLPNSSAGINQRHAITGKKHIIARVKRGVTSPRHKHKKVLKLAKGFFLPAAARTRSATGQ